MIRGEHVYLRAIEKSDVERCHAWINDPQVNATLAVRGPVNQVAEEAWVERAARRQDPTELHLAICRASDGRHIGNCGFFQIHAENRSATLGILIGERDCWGQGHGTDAVRTLCRYGFEQLNLHKIRLDVIAHNERARKVYERLGFVQEGILRDEIYRDGRYYDYIRMSLLPGELRPGGPSPQGNMPLA